MIWVRTRLRTSCLRTRIFRDSVTVFQATMLSATADLAVSLATLLATFHLATADHVKTSVATNGWKP